MICDVCKSEMQETTGEYHYQESGLDRVYLDNVIFDDCQCGEKEPRLPSLGAIHTRIGQLLVGKRGPLAPQEIKFLRKNLRLKATTLAEYIGVERESYSRWENGKQKPSFSNDRLIRLLYTSLKGIDSSEIGRFVTAVFPEINPANTDQIEIKIDCTPYYETIKKHPFR